MQEMNKKHQLKLVLFCVCCFVLFFHHNCYSSPANGYQTLLQAYPREERVASSTNKIIDSMYVCQLIGAFMVCFDILLTIYQQRGCTDGVQHVL